MVASEMIEPTKRATITLVVAVSQNGVIGRAGGLPWHLSSDLKRFKADTMGRPIIMGRKTFQSIGRLLPGRENIIVSREPNFVVQGGFVCADVETALTYAQVKAQEMGADDIAVIGGGEIYRQTFNHADRLIITWVLTSIDGDTRFPDVDKDTWLEVSSEEFAASEKDDYPTRRVVYIRRIN
jgi:dihydrofolate reductase